MATKRAKKEAKKIRLRTAIRKVVMRIRKLESKVDSSIERSSPEYWYVVASNLTRSQLELATQYLENKEYSYSYQVELFEVMREAMNTVLAERLLGLE